MATVLSTESTSATERNNENIENFSVVWFNPNYCHTEADINRVRSVVNWTRIYNERSACMDFICQNTDDKRQKIFLIISSNDSIIIDDVCHLHSIYGIYVMGTTMVTNSTNRKLKGPFNDVTAICTQLQIDTKQCDRDLIGIYAHGHVSFMYAQLFNEMMVEGTYPSDFSAQCFAKVCCSKYEGNIDEIRIINEFKETYGKIHTPIWWYTRRCFISRAMNRAIRVRDGGMLGLMSFIFRDMNLQIIELHTKTFKHEKSFTVYRGQGIEQDQFDETIVENGLIAFDNFLLTTSVQDQALEAARNVTGRDFVSIFFEINVDSSVDSPFARIGPISCAKKSKNEVLFAMFSVFRICSIKKMMNNNEGLIWHIKLTLTSTPDDSEKIKDLRKQTDGPSIHFRLSKFFIETGELDKAKDIYMISLMKMGELFDLRTRAHLHNELGFIYRKKIKWDLARIHFGMYMSLTRRYIPSDPYSESPLMISCLATEYFDHSDLEQALAFFQEQLNILPDMPIIDYDLITTAHTNLGTLFRRKGFLNEALRHQKASLDIYIKHCSSKSGDNLASIYTNLACVYFAMREYAQSVEYELKALNARRPCSDNERFVAVSHYNLARGLEQLNRIPEALYHAKRAVKIAREVMSSVHVNLEMYEIFLLELQMRHK